MKIAIAAILAIAGIVIIYLVSVNYYNNVHIIGIAKWTDSPSYSSNVLGFKDGLLKMGFVEGKDVVYIIESANGDESKQREIIKEFRDKRVDMIYSLTGPTTLIAKEEAPDVPIVYSIVTYPVEAGLIKNWYASGNNLVGTSNHINFDTQFATFSEIVSFKKIGFVHRQSGNSSQIPLEELKNYATKNNLTIIDIPGANIDDLEKNVKSSMNKIDIIYEACDTLIQNGGGKVATTLATLSKKPVFSCLESGIQDGALASVTADNYKLGYTSGQDAGFILQGIKPSSLISETEGNPSIVINLKVAQSLNINIPEYVKYQASDLVN